MATPVFPNDVTLSQYPGELDFQWTKTVEKVRQQACWHGTKIFVFTQILLYVLSIFPVPKGVLEFLEISNFIPMIFWSTLGRFFYSSTPHDMH